MATGDVWRVILHWKWGSVECRPGFHLIEGTGGPDPNESYNVYQSVIGALGATPLAGFSDQSEIDGVEVVQIQPGTLPTVFYPDGPFVGDVVDVNPLPPQSAAVLSLNTAIKPITGAYAAQGRIYLPGIPQTGQISGFLQATFQAAVSAFMSQLEAVFITDGTAYQMNVVSYTPGSRPISVRAFNPVTTWSVNNVVRSQRRREYGVGI